MKYAHDMIPVCKECELRDEAEDMTKLCEGCGIKYCQHYASIVDIKYCGNCMIDVHVTESIETKTTTYENANGVEIARRRQIARSIKLSGTDWLFANKQISLMSDEELLVSIEYHRNIAGAMLREREERQTEKLNKLSKVKINLTKRTDVDANGAKKEPKKAKAPKDKQADIIAKALAGLTPAQLQAVVAALGKK